MIPGPCEVGAIECGVNQQAITWRNLRAPVNADLLLRKYLPAGEDQRDEIDNVRPGGWELLANQRAQFPPAEVLERQLRGARRVNLVTIHRLLVGIGTPTTYGIGLTIHPLYGLPIIPGSSIKGAARSALEPSLEAGDTLDSLWNWLHPGEQVQLPPLLRCLAECPAKPLIDCLFGASTVGDPGAGFIVFQDAVPLAIPTTGPFQLDVATPHYGAYYTATPASAPNDRGNPTPVRFPVVREGITFCFPLRLTSWARDLDPQAQDAWLTIAAAILHYTMTSQGIGGKRGVGYGYFAAQRNL